ncbi:MAG: hypothetical protein AAGK21_08245 [Bacteroidota bacterium]
MRHAFLSLLLLFVVSGCDSGEDETQLDAEFYVGSWVLTAVSDDSGDLSEGVFTVVDELAASFQSSGNFRLDADLSDLANDFLNIADISIEGTYQAVSATQTLVLLVDQNGTTIAPSFTIERTSDDLIDLVAPGAVVAELLGGLPLEFTGDVALTVQRQ